MKASLLLDACRSLVWVLSALLFTGCATHTVSLPDGSVITVKSGLKGTSSATQHPDGSITTAETRFLAGTVETTAQTVAPDGSKIQTYHRSTIVNGVPHETIRTVMPDGRESQLRVENYEPVSGRITYRNGDVYEGSFQGLTKGDQHFTVFREGCYTTSGGVAYNGRFMLLSGQLVMARQQHLAKGSPPPTLAGAPLVLTDDGFVFTPISQARLARLKAGDATWTPHLQRRAINFHDSPCDQPAKAPWRCA